MVKSFSLPVSYIVEGLYVQYWFVSHLILIILPIATVFGFGRELPSKLSHVLCRQSPKIWLDLVVPLFQIFCWFLRHDLFLYIKTKTFVSLSNIMFHILALFWFKLMHLYSLVISAICCSYWFFTSFFNIYVFLDYSQIASFWP